MRAVYDYPPGISGGLGLSSPPIGHIPQVPRTYGYLRESYGMQNDQQVSIGESTTSSKSPIDEIQPASRGGSALLSATSLIELALERHDRRSKLETHAPPPLPGGATTAGDTEG